MNILNAGLIELVRDDHREKINRLLSDVLGKEFNYETLMESVDSNST